MKTQLTTDTTEGRERIDELRAALCLAGALHNENMLARDSAAYRRMHVEDGNLCFSVYVINERGLTVRRDYCVELYRVE